jgi:hypothetical protein
MIVVSPQLAPSPAAAAPRDVLTCTADSRPK